MAILVTERWSGPKIQYGTTLRAPREFDVSGVYDGASARAAVGIAKNTPHPLSTWMYAESIDPSPQAPGYWHVLVTYSSNPAGRHIDPENPLSEPIRYRFEWGNTTEGCDRDAFGNVIQNTAGQSFSGAAPTDVLNGYLIAERNEPFYDAISAVAYSNAVNNATVSFGPGGIWRLKKGQACSRRAISLTPITSATPFVTVQYTIEFRGGFKLDTDGYYDGFKIRIENEGTTGFYDDSGTATRGPIVEVINGQIQNVSSPVRLDNTGIPIEASYKIGKLTSPGYADPIANPTALPATTIVENAGDAYFVKVFPQTVKLLDLSALGL